MSSSFDNDTFVKTDVESPGQHILGQASLPHQANPAYYNAPWDAVNSRKMLLGDAMIRSGDVHTPALPQAASNTTPGSYFTQPQTSTAPMGSISGVMPSWESIAFGQQVTMPQQQLPAWPQMVPGIDMHSVLHPDLQSDLAYMPTMSHGLPQAPTSAAHGGYPYGLGADLHDVSSQSIYPIPPSYDPPSRSCSADRVLGMDSYRPMKSEHRQHLSRHMRHRSSPLRRPRSRMGDERYTLVRSPARGYARRCHSEACSPQSMSSMDDSDYDDEDTDEVMAGSAERSDRDEFLLKYRSKGWTYKQIRAKGNFSEAESTLRGRYRTLTKEKEARVRKPEWHANDVSS